ncbi:RNA polymerase sigma-70 factor, ECF subfamily [Chishuiella changwenlii]|uniref:DNA-directed RNA polymerase sigma-70 factor n=1 Tax=Chishuiella changwenlii TaxID=1434701 RepID=A0A1M6ZU54_9FLAO|nr:RNA polymerase sigma factor [Chishuiella changwenlii]GGE92548.1 DNA-directed RNA polymerase sigma-70 factor [Chishuiella changwenlii]SHL33960.1 RNA polymerase sigma-70 factor, ECF subfamily [Chishuiella changwenlii]
MDNDTLENLIKQCQEKNRKAQEEIYLQFSPILFSICLRYADNYEDAQDVFQEGFVLIFNKIDQFRFEGSFEGWMKRIMVNLSLEKIKKNNRVSFEDYENQYIQEDEEEPQQDYDYQEILENVQNLPPQYKQVFNLYVFEEYSHQEIAELLCISIGTSKSNLSRARNILKRNLLKAVIKDE